MLLAKNKARSLQQTDKREYHYVIALYTWPRGFSFKVGGWGFNSTGRVRSGYFPGHLGSFKIYIFKHFSFVAISTYEIRNPVTFSITNSECFSVSQKVLRLHVMDYQISWCNLK